MPSIRLADPRDAEAVAGLLISFRNHLGYSWPSDNAFLAGVERLLDERDTDILLGFPDADADAAPAGVAVLRYRHGIWRAGLDCLVEDVYIEDGARGQGLGKALIQAAVDHATARGARRMELDTNETNAAAIALYEGFGFTSQSTAYEGRDLYFRLHLHEPDA